MTEKVSVVSDESNTPKGTGTSRLDSGEVFLTQPQEFEMMELYDDEGLEPSDVELLNQQGSLPLGPQHFQHIGLHDDGTLEQDNMNVVDPDWLVTEQSDDVVIATPSTAPSRQVDEVTGNLGGDSIFVKTEPKPTYDNSYAKGSNLPQFAVSGSHQELPLQAGHPDRQLRRPALLIGRDAEEVKKLSASYWVNSGRHKMDLSRIVDELNQVERDKARLKCLRIALGNGLTQLYQIRDRLHVLLDCKDIDDNLRDMNTQTQVAKDQYYAHFPKEYPGAPSSVLSDSTVLSQSSANRNATAQRIRSELQGPAQEKMAIHRAKVQTLLEKGQEKMKQDQEEQEKMKAQQESIRAQQKAQQENIQAQKENIKAQQEAEQAKVRAQQEAEQAEVRLQQELYKQEMVAQQSAQQEQIRVQQSTQEEEVRMKQEALAAEQRKVQRRVEATKGDLRRTEEQGKEELAELKKCLEIEEDRAVAEGLMKEFGPDVLMPSLPQGSMLGRFLRDSEAHSSIKADQDTQESFFGIGQSQGTIMFGQSGAPANQGRQLNTGNQRLQPERSQDARVMFTNFDASQPNAGRSATATSGFQTIMVPARSSREMPTVHESSETTVKREIATKMLQQRIPSQLNPAYVLREEKERMFGNRDQTVSNAHQSLHPSSPKLTQQERVSNTQSFRPTLSRATDSYVRPEFVIQPQNIHRVPLYRGPGTMNVKNEMVRMSTETMTTTTPYTQTTATLGSSRCYSLPPTQQFGFQSYGPGHPTVYPSQPSIVPGRNPHAATSASQENLETPRPEGTSSREPPPSSHSHDRHSGSQCSVDHGNCTGTQPTVGGDLRELGRVLADVASMNRLPIQTPDVFTGDPMRYLTWKSSFTLLIGRQSISPEEKLIYLQRYLGGAAKDAVQSLFLLSGEEPYENAMEILKERFGTSYIVADAFRAKFDAWPLVKNEDCQALRALADFLQQCLVASRVIGRLKILDDAQYQRTLLDKLPRWILRGWMRRVTTAKKKDGDYPLFAELVDYIREEANIACESGSTMKQRSSQSPVVRGMQTQGNKRAGAFQTEKSKIPACLHGERCIQCHPPSAYATGEEKTVCGYCGMERHDIIRCRKFGALRPEERRKYLYDKSLCFVCALTSKHWARDCKVQPKCTVCDGAHLTLLHGVQFVPRARGGFANRGFSGRGEPPFFGQSNGRGLPPGRDQSFRPGAGRGNGPLLSEYGRDSPNSGFGGPPSAPNEFRKRGDAWAADQNQSRGGAQPNGDGTKPYRAMATDSVHSGESQRTAMIVPVYLSTEEDPNKEILTYAMIDTMSCISFVANSVADGLSARAQKTALHLNTITAQNKPVDCGKIAGLRVRGVNSTTRHRLPSVFTSDNLSVSRESIPTSKTANNHAHLRHIAKEMEPFHESCEAGLLIGFDCPELQVPLEVILGQPHAVRTELGWSVIGGVPTSQMAHDVLCTFHVHNNEDEANAVTTVAHVYRTSAVEASTTDILRMMERDFVETETGKKSQDDVRFMDLIAGNVKVNEEGHYEMPLPFRSDSPVMPDNREAARKRAIGLLKQFDKRPEHKELYQKFMKEIIANGHAEKVPDNEIETTRRWYIPHHGVYSDKKPGKIRVVFDCSARHEGVCLNDVLLQGPDLINPLIGVLCRFRRGNVAFSCDIEKMFHQFHVVEEHRDYLRFLWWEDGDTRKRLLDYRMRVHIFGAISSPGCANFGLQQVGRDHEKIDHDAAHFLQHDFYVDDGLHSSDDVNSAVRVLSKAREICEKGKLRLHKILSNSPELLEHFPASELSAVTTQNIGEMEESITTQRILGLRWLIKEDVFTFSPEIPQKPETRRGVLSTVAALYDPLGLISPVVLRGRIVLQSACRNKIDWDSELSEDLRVKWREWREELTSLGEIRVPRSFIPADFDTLKSVELHHFSDASEVGYGQCSYIRVKDVHNKVHCSLVMAKSRVAPLKTVTVPRLELQGATLSVRIAKYLETELRYENLKHFFWTDSRIVLSYLANEQKRFHVFVANRVGQILSSSTLQQWGHVRSENNPADHASRGKSVAGLNASSWFKGPDFLWESDIPSQTKYSDVPDSEMEIRVCRATTVNELSTVTMEEVFRRFSTKKPLIALIGFLLRCVDSMRKREPMSVVEMRQRAENRVLWITQQEHFANHAAMEKSFQQLDARQDDKGFWRVGGRLVNMDNYELAHPIILPSDSHIAKLWIEQGHKQLGHAGRTTVIQWIRQQGLWILGIRRVTVRTLGSCVQCKRLYAGPEGQKMADLPTDRVTPSAPFTCSGVDCFGPFVVQEGRRQLKRYGLVVTCLQTRAIHLEVLNDLSTDAFLLGLRRVIAIRGQIRLLRSDRGTNFVGASQELKRAWKAMDHERLRDGVIDLKCDWVFNPPKASHMGGVWERQIRSVRSILSGLVKKSEGRLNTSSLVTLFYEVMAIVNSRPLSVESLEDPMGPLPLTPNHILTMKSSGILPPPGVFDRADLYARKCWRRVQFLADEFWRRWRSDYLTTLQSRRKWQRQQPNIAVGDVVIMRDDAICRSDWRLARVDEVYASPDGLVRSCRVSTTSPTKSYGRRGGIIDRTSYDRPVHKLTILVKAGA